MIYRDGLVGAAGQTAPTNGLELPLQMISVVVDDAVVYVCWPCFSIISYVLCMVAMLLYQSHFNSLYSFRTKVEAPAMALLR